MRSVFSEEKKLSIAALSQTAFRAAYLAGYADLPAGLDPSVSLQERMVAAALRVKNRCAWNEDNARMSGFYRSKRELIFVFEARRSAHRNNVELGRHGLP